MKRLGAIYKLTLGSKVDKPFMSYRYIEILFFYPPEEFNALRQDVIPFEVISRDRMRSLVNERSECARTSK